MAITAVFFDFIGTTVLEKHKDIVVTCFQKAFSDSGVNIDAETIQQQRGKDKGEVIDSVFTPAKKDPKLKAVVLAAFEKHFKENVDQFSESPGLDETIEHFRSKKIKVGIGSGLPRDLLTILLEHFRWERFGFDYISTTQEIGKSRPNPEMIIDMMVKLHLNNFQFLKVGDTVADIQEGKNANVMTAAMLAGTQPDEALLGEKPDYSIRRLIDLKKIV